jgi:hypothetical protein
MKANEGITDRVIRIVAGFLLLWVIFLVEGNARWLGLIGIVPLLTGVFGYCPLYAVFGLSTCPLERKPS